MTRQRRDVFLPSTPGAVMGETAGRVAQLEQADPAVRHGRWCLTATGPGTASPELSSPWVPWDGAVKVDYMTVSTTAAVAVDVVFELLRNGVTVSTVTLPTGGTYVPLTVPGEWFAPSNRLEVRATGIGGTPWTVQLWCRGSGGGGLTVPGAAGGRDLTPRASLKGTQVIVGDGVEPSLTATAWRQSPGMDGILDATNSPARFTTLADADFRISVYAFHNTYDGSSGSAVDLHAQLAMATADSGSALELQGQSEWKDHGGGSPITFGDSATSAYHLPSGTQLQVGISHNSPVDLSITWELCIELLETTTDRSFGGL